MKELFISPKSDLVVQFESINKYFGSLKVLKDLNLSVEKGKFYSLIGESGCGKTTALRLMNGLEFPTSGRVQLNGQNFDYGQKVEVRRKMGYCPQGYTLFPHLSILENMSLVAKKSGWSKDRIRSRAEELMQLVGLPESRFLDQKPNQLSGGQQQRVSIARAIFLNPKILLMDEPFGALDPITRHEVQDSFIDLQKKLGLSVVLVTHDLSEAFKMADRIFLLEKGRLVQQGRPNQLIMKPATPYVEQFLKSNSAGHILKGIPLYTIMNIDIWVCQKKGSRYLLTNLDTEINRIIEGKDKFQQFKQELGVESLVVEIDGEGRLNHKDQPVLSSRMSLLEALQYFLSHEDEVVPVVDDKQIVVGSFGKGAFDVLS